MNCVHFSSLYYGAQVLTPDDFSGMLDHLGECQLCAVTTGLLDPENPLSGKKTLATRKFFRIINLVISYGQERYSARSK